MALDLETGRIVWTQQTMPNDVYNSSCGGRGPNCPAATARLRLRLFGDAGQDRGCATFSWPGRSPASSTGSTREAGELLWQARVGEGGTNGGVQWGMASDGRNVYAAVSDVGRQPGGIGGARRARLRALDPTQGGGLTALDVLDGRKVWLAPGVPCAPPRRDAARRSRLR